MKRYACYRLFVAETAGRLGVGNRLKLPCCVVAAIREKFPEPDGLFECPEDLKY